MLKKRIEKPRRTSEEFVNGDLLINIFFKLWFFTELCSHPHLVKYNLVPKCHLQKFTKSWLEMAIVAAIAIVAAM